jgi:hypothetical protein
VSTCCIRFFCSVLYIRSSSSPNPHMAVAVAAPPVRARAANQLRVHRQRPSLGVGQPHARQSYVITYQGIDGSRILWEFAAGVPLFSHNPKIETEPAIRRGEGIFRRTDPEWHNRYKKHSGAASTPGKLMPLTTRDVAWTGWEGLPREDTKGFTYEFVGLATDDFGRDGGKIKGFGLYASGALSAWNTSKKRIETGAYIRWGMPEKDLHYTETAEGETVPLFKLKNPNQSGQSERDATDWHQPSGVFVVDYYNHMAGKEVAHAKVIIGGGPGEQIEVQLLDEAPLAPMGAVFDADKLPPPEKIVNDWFNSGLK